MASSKALATTSLLLTLNLLLFTLASSWKCPPPPVPVNPVNPPVVPNPLVPVNPVSPPVVPNKSPKCPRDALKLGVCADLLGLVTVVLGSQLDSPCCSLLAGLADLEAAVCLCTAIKANVLGINLNVDVSLSLLLNVCGSNTPAGFKC